MALVPCNVCGTLNSEDAEICLSCEYPIRGRRRSPIFAWAAVLLFAIFTMPVLSALLKLWKQPSVPEKQKPIVSFIIPIDSTYQAYREQLFD